MAAVWRARIQKEVEEEGQELQAGEGKEDSEVMTR